jgi:hypothetical protein
MFDPNKFPYSEQDNAQQIVMRGSTNKSINNPRVSRIFPQNVSQFRRHNEANRELLPCCCQLEPP